MSFRQFPATDANGGEYQVIEFRDEKASTGPTAADPHVRYELLADGRPLVRDGNRYTTPGGELTLTA
ncbi:hypothetical protein [Stenotrophomonas bentonitica]|uniref:hypothetical protein n=1 Tax=Stenotrophomonas bentonitica TaxID=1450134 RepID=UPI00345F0505